MRRTKIVLLFLTLGCCHANLVKLNNCPPDLQNYCQKTEKIIDRIVIGRQGKLSNWYFKNKSIDINVYFEDIPNRNDTIIIGTANPLGFAFVGKYTRPFTTSGKITINKDFFYNSSSMTPSMWLKVFVHETFHVLGFGTLWGSWNLLGYDKSHYVGKYGLVYYNRQYRRYVDDYIKLDEYGHHWLPDCNLIDVEGHKQCFDIMVPSIRPHAELTPMTIASLVDIGYLVNSSYLNRNNYVDTE